MRSTCSTCGQGLPMDRYVVETCQRCETTDIEAQQHHAAEHPGCPESDILYAGRMAKQQHAIRPSSNYVDPRAFSAARRGLPTPPATSVPDLGSGK